MRPARPTLRCLRDDLRVPLPPVSHPLDEVDHPLLRKAGEQFADAGIPHERIVAIDDQVLFKVKVQRWRGAVWVEPDQPWLVAAGRREDGSCVFDDWMPEFNLPDRRLDPGEHAFSNIMNPVEAAKLLELDSP
jgi:hypothetical protein